MKYYLYLGRKKIKYVGDRFFVQDTFDIVSKESSERSKYWNDDRYVVIGTSEDWKIVEKFFGVKLVRVGSSVYELSLDELQEFMEFSNTNFWECKSFDVGDSVEVIKGKYQKLYGTVEHIVYLTGSCWIDLEIGIKAIVSMDKLKHRVLSDTRFSIDDVCFDENSNLILSEKDEEEFDDDFEYRHVGFYEHFNHNERILANLIQHGIKKPLSILEYCGLEMSEQNRMGILRMRQRLKLLMNIIRDEPEKLSIISEDDLLGDLECLEGYFQELERDNVFYLQQSRRKCQMILDWKVRLQTLIKKIKKVEYESYQDDFKNMVFDESGFVIAVLRRMGVLEHDFPHIPLNRLFEVFMIERVEKPQVGDLVFFGDDLKKIESVGLLVGRKKVAGIFGQKFSYRDVNDALTVRTVE